VHTGGKPLFWERVRYTGRVKVVADIAARMEIEGLGVRQCVVKIPSLQRLSEPAGEGYETADKVQESSNPGRMLREMETTEYMVMQKKVMNGKEGEWVLWGTVEPSKWQTGRLRRRIAGSF
jgi:protein MBA1